MATLEPGRTENPCRKYGGLVQNDDQEVHYEMLKLNAPDEASGEFWFRMAEILSTLPPNRSLDLRMNGGRLTTAVSILSVMIEDNPDMPQLWAQKIIALNYLAHGHKARADGLAQQPRQSGRSQRGGIPDQSPVAKPVVNIGCRACTFS